MITAFLVAFGTVFLAELPDKTMVASLVRKRSCRSPAGGSAKASRKIAWSVLSDEYAIHTIGKTTQSA